MMRLKISEKIRGRLAGGGVVQEGRVGQAGGSGQSRGRQVGGEGTTSRAKQSVPVCVANSSNPDGRNIPTVARIGTYGQAGAIGRAVSAVQAIPLSRTVDRVAAPNARAPNVPNVSNASNNSNAPKVRGEVQAFINYDQYKLSRSELVKCLMIWSGLLFFITYSFYQSLWLSLLVTPLSCLLISFDRKKLIAKRKQRMRLQLKDVLLSLVSSLSVGRSLENCFAVASEDMAMLYHRTDVELIGELEIINHRTRNGENIIDSLQKLAERANIEELTQFVEALQTCKRSGGDLLAVMRRTATMLSDQIAVDNEIKVLLAQKKLEGRIMMATPFVFLQFFHSMSPSYMAALKTPFGYMLLTIILLLLFILFWIMDRVMTIRL